MKTRVTWNLYSAVLLLNAYVTIKRNSKKRNQVILKLSQFLRGQIDKKKEIASDAYASTVDINQKLGKMECLMTDGERGLPGVVLPCMTQAVDLYRNDHELYLLYKKAAKKKMTLSQFKKYLEKKEKKKEAVLQESVVVEAKPVKEISAEPEVDAEAIVEKKTAPIAMAEAASVLDVRIITSVEATESEVDVKEDLGFVDLLPLDASVQELQLSARLENVLCRNGIFTIGDMLNYPENRWMDISGMGQKTFGELAAVLRRYKTVKLVESPDPVIDKTAYQKVLDMNGESLPLRDSVEILPVSNRLKDTMLKNGIRTIDDMLNYPSEKWEQLYGMGKGTLAELDEFFRLHQKIVPVIGNSGDVPNLQISYDTPLWKLDFGRKNNVVLQKAGFQNLRDVLRYPTEKWYSLPGTSVSWIENLLNRIEIYRQMARATVTKKLEMEAKGVSAEELALEAKSIAAFADMIGLPYENMMEILHEAKVEDESVAEKLWKQENVQAAIKVWILRFLKNCKYEGAATGEISAKFPEVVYDEVVFAELLSNLQGNNQIRKIDDMIFCVYPSLVEYLSTTNEKTRKIIEARLEGKSLEVVAQILGVTRERVRQIQKKFFEKMPLIEEGYWLSVQKKYEKLTKEDFGFVFQLPSKIVTLLQLWSGGFATIRSGSKESRIHALYEVMNDPETDEATYKRVQMRLREINPHFSIGGKQIPVQRDALMRFAIKTYCQEQRTITELKDFYDNLRKEIGGEATDPSFEIDVRYLEHYFDSMNVLTGGRKRLRYYDILANEYGELLDELDFGSYSNVTMSATKFFQDYPELMERYDIRSGNELHNLLKKLWEHGHYNDYVDDDHKLTFEKMPMLTFGTADRAQQIVQLLRENNPISYMDFAKLIETEFGVSQQTAMANWIEPVDEYLVNGMYAMPESSLPRGHLERLMARLSEDYYLTAEIRNAYVEEYPEVNPWDIGIAAMYQIGFISHGKYAVRNTYKSASDFFEQLFDESVVDVRDKSEYSLSSSYSLLRQKLQEEYRIVEVEPQVFYNIRYLNELGITKAGILAFCKEVYDFVSDGKCFTIHSLKRRGFTLPWAEGDWTDWFYAALLSSDKEHFNSQRLGSMKLLRRRKMERKLTLADLLEEVTEEAAYMLTVEEICQMLKFRYGLEVARSKIREIAESDDLFADRILY